MSASPLLHLPRKRRAENGLRNPSDADSQRASVYRLARKDAVGYAVEGVSRDTLIRLIDFPELPLRIHTRDTIKAGRTALLVRGEFPIGGRMVSVGYKRVKRRGMGKILAGWLLGNRTFRTWRMGHTLEQLGIPTARPLMVVVPRWHRPTSPSYLALEWLDQAKNLTVYSEWLEGLTEYKAQNRLHAAAEKLGEVLGKMHKARVSHRDLKAGNLLLVNLPSSVDAYVIDLDGARRFLWLPRIRRERDLSRLALALESDKSLTNTARLRFLKSYLHAMGENADDWKRLWKKLNHLTRKRQVKKSRRHPHSR